MEWQFNLSDGLKSYTLKAELIYRNHQIEHIKVSGEGVSIVLQSNRPLLEEIESKSPVNWKIIKGKLNDTAALERMIKAVEYSLKARNKAVS